MTLARHRLEKRKAVASGADTWHAACRSLCRIGSYKATLEVSRFHANTEHQAILKPFEGQRWIGWIHGNSCCRIAPACAIAQFDEDRRTALTRFGPIALALMGDSPVEIHVRTKGRITLPAHLTIPTHIDKDDKIIVMPRLGFLEIWKHETWQSQLSRLSDAISVEASGQTHGSPEPAAVSRDFPTRAVVRSLSSVVNLSPRKDGSHVG